MSLTKVSLLTVVKKQYIFKLKAFIQMLTTLVVLQLMAIFFSFNGIAGMGIGGDSISINVKYYSADFVIAFTMLWAFISSILITTKAYRYDDFAFVTNRLSSNLSNALFLLTASVIGGITAMMSSYVIKLIMYYFASDILVKTSDGMAATSAFLVGTSAAILYVFLFCALGYLVGTLVQLHRIFVVLLPGMFFGLLFFGRMSENAHVAVNIFRFIFAESSIALFYGKTIVTSCLLFGAAFVLSNRMEVRS